MGPAPDYCPCPATSSTCPSIAAAVVSSHSWRFQILLSVAEWCAAWGQNFPIQAVSAGRQNRLAKADYWNHRLGCACCCCSCCCHSFGVKEKGGCGKESATPFWRNDTTIVRWIDFFALALVYEWLEQWDMDAGTRRQTKTGNIVSQLRV